MNVKVHFLCIEREQIQVLSERSEHWIFVIFIGI